MAEFSGIWWNMAELGRTWQNLMESSRIWQVARLSTIIKLNAPSV